MPPSDPRVDELRQQLRALGYLDAGVDRFVLGPAREKRRPAAIALLASVRTGLIAAVLLGPAAAVGIGGRLPGLVTGPRDGVVMAIYMGALFGIAVAVIAFLASLLFAALAGERVAARAPRLSRAAGGIVTVACLAYLTLWWNTANAGFGLAAPAWTIFALLVAVVISLLLGHAASVTAFAVMIAGHAKVTGAHMPPPRASWPVMLGAGALAFAGSAILLASTGGLGPRSDAAAPPSLSVISSGTRVHVFAVDGFDPGVYTELAQAGQVPALHAAFATARARLRTEDTRDPARTWTTVATGQTPDVHGVQGLETTRVAGVQGTVSSARTSPVGRAVRGATDLLRLTRPAIASGTERRVKTFWEVASDAGLRTVVVNWWASWPVPRDEDARRGVVLSDRATLRLERGGQLDAEIAPAALYPALEQQWPSIRSEATARAVALLQLPPTLEDAVSGVLRRSAEIDAMQLGLLQRVVEPSTDLAAVYLPGLDIAQHALLGPSEGALGASAAAARVAAIQQYYRFLDRLLAPSLDPQPGVLVMIVTEPGRIASSAEGLLGLAGAGVAVKEKSDTPPASYLEGATTVDVAPTILHALGVPVSRQLAGSPLQGLFDESYRTKYPVRWVSSYGRPAVNAAERKGQPLDQEMIDRLRSLGYVR